jgi:FMN phosphatase YigB (HAD superfamily)
MSLALFDLDNTLIDRAGAFMEWARIFLAEHRLGGDAEIEWLEENDNDGLTPRADFFTEVRMRYGLGDALGDALDHLVAAYRLEYPRCVQPPPDETRAALEELRDHGWKLAIVTNGSQAQQAKIAAAGLTALVEARRSPRLLGRASPNLPSSKRRRTRVVVR